MLKNDLISSIAEINVELLDKYQKFIESLGTRDEKDFVNRIKAITELQYIKFIQVYGEVRENEEKYHGNARNSKKNKGKL